MFFSIICPAYNVEKYIIDCIESVKNQSFSDWELIIVNDQSIDNTLDIIKNNIFDSRISVYSIDHSGQTKAREFGLKMSKGKYIVFLDADDYLYDDTLLCVFELITQYDCDIVSFGMKYFEKKEEIISLRHPFSSPDIINKDTLLEFYYGKTKTMSLCGNVFKKENVIKAFEAIPHQLVTIRFCEDFVAVFEVINASTKAVVLKQPFYYYRVNLGSVSHTKHPDDRLNMVMAYEHVYGNYFKYCGKEAFLDDKIKTFLAYLPIMLFLRTSNNKKITFLYVRDLFLFHSFSIKQKWNSIILKIITIAIKYKCFYLACIFGCIYKKRNKV